jgi:hypothetical protein
VAEALGDQVDEGGSSLVARGREGGKDFKGVGTGAGSVAAGDFAGNDGRPQLPLGQIIGGINGIVIEEGEEVVSLFEKALADGFLGRFGSWEAEEEVGSGFKAAAGFLEG